MTNASRSPTVKTSPFDLLLIEAGSVTSNAGSAVFRNASARAVAALFLPGPPDVSAGRSGAARALRETIKAYAVASTSETREQIANAIVGLASVVRAEPETSAPTMTKSTGAPRMYWMKER